MKTAILLIVFPSIAQCAFLFEPNRGQTASEAKFLARTPSGSVFFTDSGIVLNKENRPVVLSFPGSTPGPWTPLQPSGQTTSYFVGRDRSKWIHALGSYKRLSRENLYPGIDLVLYGNQDHKLEYDLIVAPGVDPSQIRLRTSATAAIDKTTGDLVIAQSIRQRKPTIYQGATQVEGRFKELGKGEFGFEIGAYDRTKPLVIDPTIESQEYIGGIGDETVAAYQANGSNLVGTTTSIDFPGAPLGTRHGTDLYYRGTFGTIILGGSGNETAAPFLLRRGASTTVGGTTDSRDLPTADGSRVPFQPEYAGGATDGFLATLLDSNLPRVTYFGTSGEDRITAANLAFGSSMVVFAGSTNGTNLPRGQNTDGRTLNGGFDGFLVIANWPDVEPLTVAASAYIGGASDDFVTAINPFRSEAGIYLAGETRSADFPLLNGAQIQRRGISDGFVTRLEWTNNNSLTLLGGTLLGGASNDRIGSLTVLDSGDIAVGGTTSSVDFPTVNPPQANYGGGASDAFVSILAGSLARQSFSTYWGGSGSEETLTIARNRTGSAVLIGGRTTSTDFPVRNALQTRYGGGVSDGFFLHVGTAGGVLQASYFGGSGEDEISAADGINDVDAMNLAGTSNSSDLPGFLPPASLEPLRGGTKDVFVIRVSSFEGFLPQRVVGAPLLVAEAPLRFGQDPIVRSAGRITATSTDPSAVLVSFSSSATATSTDTSLWTSSGNPPAALYLECQKSDVEAFVNVAVPGLQEQRVRVVCATGSLELRPSELDAPIWAGRRLMPQVYTGVVDPLTGVRIGMGLKFVSGASRNAIVGISNSQVAGLVDRFGNRISELPINLGPSPNHILRMQDPGEATISVFLSGFPQTTKTIRVVPAGDERALSYRIAAGYSTSGWISSAYGSVPVSGSARTLDPSRLLLSLDNATWVNEVQVTDRGSFYILGLPNTPIGSQAQIEVRQNGVPQPFVQTVQFDAAEIALNIPLQDTITLYEGSAQGFQPYLRAGLQRLYVPAGVAIPNLTATSSNVAAVPVPAPAPLTNSNAALSLTAAKEGTSTVTLQAPAGLRLASDFQRPVTVKVVKTSLRINAGVDVNLGKDLTARIPVTLFGSPLFNSPVASCTVDRLDLVRFVSGFSLLASQEVMVDQTQLHVQGMASSGLAVVTCQAPGYPPATARIQLRPTGFVWEQPETKGATPGGTMFIPYRPAALDPATNLPLAMQEFGVLSTPRPVPQIDNSNPDVLRFDAGIWRILQAGEATLTLRQPAGLLTPAVRQRHRFATARFSNQTLVSIVVVGSGAVDGCNANPCVSLRDPGSSITLTPRPAPGFRFERWNNNCAEICTLTVPPVTGFGISLTVSFVPIAGSTASKFVTIEPCRLVDTRLATGPLGGPAITARGTRNFPLRGSCGVPSNATAYSLNVTVVPRGSLGYLTIWPGGQTQPVVSTLNSLDGRVKANAAIVPASAIDGSVDVFATDLTDVILDINGYFVTTDANAQSQFLVSVPPCRVLDTRLPGGGGQIAALNNRRIRISGGACGLPETARSYVLNVTAIPKTTLGYLTLWPANGSPRPTVSTLNAVTGAVTANMAIVSGASGEIDAFVTDAADLVIDVNGYFTQFPGQGTEGLQFYANTSPCRVLDTRLANGPLGGPAMVPTTPREFGFPSSNCGVPANAKAYAVNATVVPTGLLGYLTLYPAGTTRPVVSTLNAVDGGITSNGAIVRSGVNGGVAAFATERTHLLIDIGGYFAP